MPRVTVLMPTYNVAPWVEEAVRSVLAQTYSDFELLVMDDCSTDNTVAIVQSIEDSRIRIVRNEQNLGLSENLNKGLSLIDTEYVSRMDGDDIAEPTWLEKEVAVLDANPKIGICSAGFQRFGTSDSVVRFPERHEDVVANMLFGCTVIVPTFRRSLYSEQGLRYSPEAFPAEDYHFWAQCIRHTKVYNIQETLFYYRMHATQICSSKREIQKVKVGEVRRYMLDWLNPNMSQEDIRYFVEEFADANVKDRHDVNRMHSFSKLLLKHNREVGHLQNGSLKKRLRVHIVQSTYRFIVSRYFVKGYSLANYARYLFSGLALQTNCKYEAKFFLKSLLKRQA